MSQIETHERVNDILTGPLERPALAWLATRMPAWVTPDILTIVGILGAVVIFASYGLSNLSRNFLWLVNLGFVINWFGDSLDGTLARHRKIERPKYGFFVDHTADAFGQLLIFTGLGLSPYLRFDTACLVFIGYLLMSVLVYVRTSVSGVFQISYGKIGPTEMRLIAVLVNILIYLIGVPETRFVGDLFNLYDLIGLVIAGALLAVFLGSSVRQASALSKIDPYSG